MNVYNFIVTFGFNGKDGKMETSFQIRGRILIVELETEIDHHYADALQKEMNKKMQHHVVKHMVFDFKNVTFMDSSGIGLIMGGYKKTDMVGGKLVLCNVRERIKKILQMSGVDKWIICEKDLKAVIKLIEG